MNTLKKIALAAIAVSAVSVSSATVSFSSSAFSNAPGISTGDVAVLLIAESASADFSQLNLIAGTSITQSASYGDLFTVALGTSKTAIGTTTVLVSGAFNGISLTNGVDAGDKFAFVVFRNSTSTSNVLEGDTYTIWTDPTWVIPADGSNLQFQAAPTGLNFKQMTSTSSAAFTKTVATTAVPEPSSFAAFVGLAAVGFASTRRRRSA